MKPILLCKLRIMYLRNKQEKLNKGIKIISSQHELMHQDSINVDSEIQISQEFDEEYGTHSLQKFGSFTDNDELGKSHYNESIGSIHNIWIDPTSESYIEAKKRENIAKIKPSIIPVLNFAKLNRPDLIQSVKNKGDAKINKSIKVSSSGKVAHYSLSNRTPDEFISFSMKNEHEESNTATINKASIEIAADEAQLLFHEKEDGNHILIKEINDVSSNLLDSRHQESNISKAHYSWFANSSNTTKKKVYSNIKNQVVSVASPVLQASFEK